MNVGAVVGEEEEANFKSSLISGLSGTELEVAITEEDVIEELKSSEEEEDSEKEGEDQL